jgi:hypothetical protein
MTANMERVTTLLAFSTLFGFGEAGVAAGVGAAAPGAVTTGVPGAAGAVAAGAAAAGVEPGAVAAFLGSSAKAAAATVRAKLAAIMIFL